MDDAVAAMEAVTLEDPRRLARQILDLRNLHPAIVGPFRSDKRFAALLPS